MVGDLIERPPGGDRARDRRWRRAQTAIARAWRRSTRQCIVTWSLCVQAIACGPPSMTTSSSSPTRPGRRLRCSGMAGSGRRRRGRPASARRSWGGPGGSRLHVGMHATAAVARLRSPRSGCWNAWSLIGCPRTHRGCRSRRGNPSSTPAVALAVSMNPSNRLPGRPPGLSPVCSRNGGIGDTSTPSRPRRAVCGEIAGTSPVPIECPTASRHAGRASPSGRSGPRRRCRSRSRTPAGWTSRTRAGHR